MYLSCLFTLLSQRLLFSVYLLHLVAHTVGTSSPSMQGTSSVKPAGKKITVSVDSMHPLNVEIPNIGHLSGPAGAFLRSGSITIQPEKASFANSSIFLTSG